MKVINFNVVGTPTDVPNLSVDGGETYAASLSGQRATFSLPDRANGGGTVFYAGGKAVRIIVPSFPGAWEADLPPVKPPEMLGRLELVYDGSGLRALRVQGDKLRVQGDKLYEGDSLWKLKGSTDFRLGELFFNNRPQFDATLAQRINCGANLMRMLCMKANNTGWSFMLDPGRLEELLDAVEDHGMRLLVTIFADTASLMPQTATQQGFYFQVWNMMLDRCHLLQLCNEWNHPTQKINPQIFAKPDGIISCHGSGLTDADPVQPRWDVAFYHARRDALPDARGITNYCSYEFQARYPQECPKAPAEGLKPRDYNFDTSVAELMGRHAGMGIGGIFHTDAGVNGGLWTSQEEECAKAFYKGVAA